MFPLYPKNDLKKVAIPIVQIMGFDTHIYLMRLVSHSLYTIEDIFHFYFPTSSKNILMAYLLWRLVANAF
ncbi:hypothetical protein EDC94DRAFT_625833 [Helicostylum pulchrum]|nr:hypothetical protein EDC94DRAFT_625833 [Helicostylum pulchrum]